MELVHRAAAACLIFTLLDTVGSQVYVCAPVRVEVLLSCVCSELHRRPRRGSVSRGDKEDGALLDVVLRSRYARFQHHLFTGRRERSPHLHREGAFPILPKSPQMPNSSYSCYLPQLSFRELLNLTVSDDCVPEPQAPPGPSSGDTRLSPGCLHLITGLTLLVFLWLNPSARASNTN